MVLRSVDVTGALRETDAKLTPSHTFTVFALQPPQSGCAFNKHGKHIILVEEHKREMLKILKGRF